MFDVSFNEFHKSILTLFGTLTNSDFFFFLRFGVYQNITQIVIYGNFVLISYLYEG